MNVLCIATYFKGETFLEACHRLGHRVYLLTAEDLKDEPWPREHIEDIFYLPGDEDSWRREDLIAGVSYLARTIKFDRIVPLDDFDLEKAALLREHLRIPGMGDTRTRYFRDKLAMRTQARDHGIPVPAFVHGLNYDEIRRFARSVPAPWVLKPRSSASAAGIKKIHSEAQLWTEIEKLGDEQSFYLLEQFIPGDIYHVDAIVFGEEVVFARAHRYLDPPLQVAHEGGIFATANIPYDAPEETSLLQMNADVIRAMGLRAGVSHTEFNLWAEWARIETLPAGETYQLPPIRRDYSGVIISLARQEHPDLSGYTDPEIVWRLNKPFHAGLIVRSSSYDRVQSLLRSYIDRFYRDFFASVPAPEKPTS